MPASSETETPFELRRVAAAPPMTRLPYFEVERGFAESPLSEVIESSGETLTGAGAEWEQHDFRVAPEADHFAPIALEAESLLNRFFERIEGYEAEALSETEIERV